MMAKRNHRSARSYTVYSWAVFLFLVTISVIVLVQPLKAQQTLALQGEVSIEVKGRYFVSGNSASYEKVDNESIIKVKGNSGVCSPESVLIGDNIIIYDTKKTIKIKDNSKLFSDRFYAEAELMEINSDNQSFSLNNLAGLATLELFEEKLRTGFKWDTQKKCKEMILKMYAPRNRLNETEVNKYILSARQIFLDNKNKIVRLKSNASFSATNNDTKVTGNLIEIYLDDENQLKSMRTSGDVNFNYNEYEATTMNLEFNFKSEKLVARGPTKIKYNEFLTQSNYLEMSLGQNKKKLITLPTEFIRTTVTPPQQ